MQTNSLATKSPWYVDPRILVISFLAACLASGSWTLVWKPFHEQVQKANAETERDAQNLDTLKRTLVARATDEAKFAAKNKGFVSYLRSWAGSPSSDDAGTLLNQLAKQNRVHIDDQTAAVSSVETFNIPSGPTTLKPALAAANAKAVNRLPLPSPDFLRSNQLRILTFTFSIDGAYPDVLNWIGQTEEDLPTARLKSVVLNGKRDNTVLQVTISIPSLDLDKLNLKEDKS